VPFNPFKNEQNSLNEKFKDLQAMNNIKGIPYLEVVFDKDGKRQNTPVVPNGTTDLIVMSHGWNNTAAAAEDLYTKLFSNFVDATAGDQAIAARKIAIVGVIWPSKKFDDLMTQLEGNGKAPGGAKSLSAADQAQAEGAMIEAIKRAAPIFDDPGNDEQITRLQALVPKLEDDSKSQEEFVKILRELIDPANQHQDQRSSEDSSDIFFEGQPAIIFKNASQSVPASAAPLSAQDEPQTKDTAPASQRGGAQAFGDFFSKAANAVTNLMNLSTYYTMKQRAGTVGKNGVAPLIDELSSQVQQIHLVGHSFGGRVVTAAAANSTTKKLRSMSLLQAAFSQNGFSKVGQGSFRTVISDRRVSGPILVTNTKKDLSVGLAYPAASRISGDTAAAFGGADDPFGGIGSNGAQQMEPGEISNSATTLGAVNYSYKWEPGRIHNLKDDRFIVDPNGGDAHGFVFVPQVAWAISRAIVA
jgi:hypothetical protein